MKTKQGETWDEIAWRELGMTKYVEELMDANREYIETQIFEGGIELVLPTVSSVLKEVKAPWMST